MPYVERDSETSAIKGVYANLQEGYAEEFLADDDAEVVAFLNPPTSQGAAPRLYAVAKLAITAGSVDGIDVNSRFSAGLYLDVGSYLLFFAETQPDTSYLAKAYDSASSVRVTETTTDYIAITATDGSGTPTDPAVVSVEIIRVG